VSRPPPEVPLVAAGRRGVRVARVRRHRRFGSGLGRGQSVFFLICRCSGCCRLRLKSWQALGQPWAVSRGTGCSCGRRKTEKRACPRRKNSPEVYYQIQTFFFKKKRFLAVCF
jgi:hypothetical protein